MSTESPLTPAAAGIAHRALKPAAGTPTLGGLDNLFRKEMGDWFHTRRWLGQALVWVGIINVFMAFVMFVVPVVATAQGDPEAPTLAEMGEVGLQMFFGFLVTGGSIGTAILAQDEVIGEKQTGTAAWILSKPLSRAAFILGKLAANTIGILVFIVGIPSLLGYGEIWLALGRPMAAGPFLAGVALAFLTMLFYLTLALMLGVLFDARGGVIGICLGLALGGAVMVSLVPQLANFLPLTTADFGVALVKGLELPPFAPMQIGFTAVWCVVFTLVALWRFRHTEF